jgi:TRAP-type uncharacterized transport system substrate-binding protein
MVTIQKHLPVVVIILLVILLALGVYGFVKTQQSVPPRDFVILVDEQGGGYTAIAQQYQQLFKLRDVDLTVQSTSGAQEAFRLLEEGQASLALVPGYMTKDANRNELASLGAVAYEPLWIFYNPDAFGDQPLTLLGQLEGKLVSIGAQNGKTYPLAAQLLTESGVTAENATLLELSTQEAADQLRQGAIDALIALEPYQAQTIQDLLRAPGTKLANLARIDAYATRQRALTPVTLAAGVVDLERDIPAEDTTLLASATNLVMRRDLNPTMGRSMIIASLLLNAQGDYLSEPFAFPNLEATDLPVLAEYADFFDRVQSGAFSLESRLPFWMAHTIERLIFFLIPIGLLLGLLVIYAPALWRWHMRGKVLPYYKQLRKIEIDLPNKSVEQIDAALGQLAGLDAELARRVRVSVSYLPEVYQLRVHVRYIVDDLIRRREQLVAGQAVPATQDSQRTREASA